MYASIEDFKAILPNSITIGTTNIGTSTPLTPPSVNRDKLTPAEVVKYIRFAQQEIDSRLRPFYTCPLRRIKTNETDILESISSGTNVNVKVWDSMVFAKGDTIRLQGKYVMELSLIYDVPDEKTITISTVVNNYPENSQLSIVEFPDPIPLVAARLAVSYAFDQLFSAQQAPNISEYGKEQRKLAINSMDNILSGTVLLIGQELTGMRFVKASLLDSWASPTKDFQFGREKS